jgi:hypothetical protein
LEKEVKQPEEQKQALVPAPLNRIYYHTEEQLFEALERQTK